MRKEASMHVCVIMVHAEASRCIVCQTEIHWAPSFSSKYSWRNSSGNWVI